ncbi:MAG: hypothetical protein EOO89_26170, partial [Pedobacter sp.]
MINSYVKYSPEVEQPLENEQQLIDDVIASMNRLDGRTKEMYGKHVRVSHAKSHGLAVGKLVVQDNLPDHLAQGLFSKPDSFDIIVRLANVPGEIITDAVNTQRGFSFKILGVNGEKISGHTGQTTQDFVLDTGSYFPNPDVKSFLMQHRMIEHAPQIPTVVKEAVSTVARVTNEALNSLGTDSAKLDFLGDSKIHPLAEAYFSQVPIRYGDYIAKLAVVPASQKQKQLMRDGVEVNSKDENALRTATVDYLRENDAEFEVQIQLCTDLDKMPIENANMDWKHEDSPYLTVGHIYLPKQEAYSEARKEYVEALSFSPAHSLEVFRPLGSIMRARLQLYPV